MACIIDSSYELLLGRAPSAHEDKGQAARFDDVNYWKGRQFIANWNAKTIDTFRVLTFASELEHVFRSKRDAYIVATWLNENNKNFTDLLYVETDEYSCEISSERFRKFLASIDNDDGR
jgi:hypothetical protein